MKHEIERKFSVTDEVSFLQRLTSLGVELSLPVLQIDRIYLLAGTGFDDLNTGKPVVRIRESNDIVTATAKIYCDGILDRLEAEQVLPSPNQFADFLHVLGFVEVVQVRKTRRTARLGEVAITFDQVEGLGTFTELEVRVPNGLQGPGTNQIPRHGANPWSECCRVDSHAVRRSAIQEDCRE